MQVPKFDFGFEFGQRKTVGISVGGGGDERKNGKKIKVVL